MTAEARAWGELGHQIVCDIAWREMADGVQSFVKSQMGDDPSYSTFARSCVWPDDVRDDHEYDWAKQHHYLNVPPATEYDPASQCQARGCLPRSIGQHAQILLRTTEPADARRESLRFLGHFVGDIHQPLHVSYPQDRGGTRIDVTLCDGNFCSDWKLHGVWDTGLISTAHRPWRELALELQESITDEQRSQWRSADVRSWIEESFQLSETKAYRTVSDGEVGNDYIGDLPESDRRFRASYIETMRPIVYEQLKKAGVRLAFVVTALAAGATPEGLDSTPALRVTPDDGVQQEVRVRAAPGHSQPKIAALLPGEQAELIGVLDQWYRVRLKDGRYGYLHPDAVELLG